jgi:HlyD family secretion protein
MSYLGVIKKLFRILSRKQLVQLLRLQILISFMAFVEVIGVASFGPFLQLAGNPELVVDNKIFANIYNYFEFQNPQDFTIFFGFLVISILFFATIFSTLTIRFLLHYAQVLGAAISSSLYQYYMHQSWLFHVKNNSSSLMNKVNAECTRVTVGIIYPFMMLNARVVLAISIVTLLFITDPLITIIGISAFGVIYLLIFRIVRSRLSKQGEAISLLQGKRFKLMNEGFGSIRDVILLKKDEVFSSDFSEASYLHGKANGSISTMNEVPKFWVELVAFSTMISLVLILLIQNQGSLLLILPKLGIFAFASYKLLPAFQQIYMNSANIKAAMPALDNIYDDMIGWKKIESQKGFTKNLSDEPIQLFSSLNLSNISFSYTETKKRAIEDVSLEIYPNQLIGFVGESGSGKSTLADLLIGLISPEEGIIKIDGVELNSANIKNWQTNIGYVPQSIFLTDATVAENIAFGVDYQDIDISKVNLAVKLANLESAIDKLQNGVNSIIGEKGVQLSGGQRQRIAIARALYNNPSLLVFDEATSALDGMTEKAIMESINSLAKNKTIIMIAHRLNTVKNCDKIFLFDNGKLIDSGSYKELKDSNVLFKNMIDNS